MTDAQLDAAVAREVMGRAITPDWEPSKNLTHAFVAMEKAAGGRRWQLNRLPSTTPIYQCHSGSVSNLGGVQHTEANSASRALSLCALAVVRGRG